MCIRDRSVRARQGEPNTLGVCNLLREHSRSKLYKEIRAFSSVGQSNRLITGRSRVRIPEGPPFISQWYRGIAQLVEQWSPKPRAEGSSPSAPAKYADVAQVVAHILGKDEVTSSSLVISSKTVIVFYDDRFCFVQNIRGYVLFEDVSSFSFAKKTLQKVLTSILGRTIIKIPSILVKNILLLWEEGLSLIHI